MLDLKELEQLGHQAEFTNVGYLDRKTIRLRQEVRQMCSSNNCGAYGTRWSCPPGCGTLEECQQRLEQFQRGILVQTVGNLEDELDYESMMETERLHKAHFDALYQMLRPLYPGMLAVGAGACTRCKTCTYPDAPCRFPDKAYASMEAYGMLVLEVCKANGMTYYYGPNTIAYTGCFLLE